MADESLKQKTARGLFWGLVNNGTMQFLNLLFGICLGRLLSPDDYGMVGMLTVFSLIAGSLQESGFTAALANKKEIRHEDYNAVFWFSIGVSFLLYWILFFCAPWIADFYHQPELIPLGRYAFLGFFISSLGIVPAAYIFRNLMVKQKAIATALGLVVSGIAGITLAYCGFSYWGLATQSLLYVAVLNLYLWMVCPWRPTLAFNFHPVREMFGFSSKLLLTNIFTTINNNIFSILLGRFYSEKEVGQFNQASKWNYMGHTLITGMVNSVAQPMFVRIADDSDRQVRAFRKMLRFTSFIAFPAMFGLAFVAPELIVIAITDKWLTSARLLQILAIGGAFLPIAGLYTNLLISKGKSNIYLYGTVVLGVIQWILMLLLSPYGLFLMVSVYVGVNILWLLVWQYFVHRELPVSLFQALKDILPFAGIAAGVMGVTYYITLPIGNIYMLALAKILLAAALYTGIMWVSKSVTFRECLDFLMKRKNKG